jgi:hypothetical protein
MGVNFHGPATLTYEPEKSLRERYARDSLMLIIDHGARTCRMFIDEVNWWQRLTNAERVHYKAAMTRIEDFWRARGYKVKK